MRPRKYDWRKIFGGQDEDAGVYRLAKNGGVEILLEYKANGAAETLGIEMHFPNGQPIKQTYNASTDEIVGELNELQHQFLLSHYTDVEALKAAIYYKGVGRLPKKVGGTVKAFLSKLPEALGHEEGR